MLELGWSVRVPPPNCSVVPAAPVYVPVSVPPPLKLSVPVCTETAEVLLNVGLMFVVPVPAVFWNVPRFVNVPPPPPMSPVPVMSQVPVFVTVLLFTLRLPLVE